MSKRHGTPAHNIRIPPELWAAAQAKAAAKGTNVSAEIVRWMQGWVKRPTVDHRTHVHQSLDGTLTVTPPPEGHQRATGENA